MNRPSTEVLVSRDKHALLVIGALKDYVIAWILRPLSNKNNVVAVSTQGIDEPGC